MAAPKLPDPESLLPTFAEIIRSGQLTKGEQLRRFEEESAQYLGVSHCVGVSSCTSGLMLVLQALKRRTGGSKKVKVAVPSFTFLASVTALAWAGFEPVFVDVDPQTMNLCLEDLERVLEADDIAGVLAVHCFGNPVPRDLIEPLCQKAGVPLLFDAAHGFGSIYQDRKVGQGGWCQVFSLPPTKMVVAGEGGVIATNDQALADELRIGREYGNDGRYDTVFPGLNARLSELHCCLARASLAMLDDVVAHRNEVAGSLRAALSEIPGLGFQQITPESRTTYKDFTVTFDPQAFGTTRDKAAAALLAEGIPSRKYFAPPCHRHQAFLQYDNRALANTETLASSCLSLPLLNEDSVAGLASALAKLQRFSGEIDKGD